MSNRAAPWPSRSICATRVTQAPNGWVTVRATSMPTIIRNISWRKIIWEPKKDTTNRPTKGWRKKSKSEWKNGGRTQNASERAELKLGGLQNIIAPGNRGTRASCFGAEPQRCFLAGLRAAGETTGVAHGRIGSLICPHRRGIECLATAGE